jgi:hypothetical protein
MKRLWDAIHSPAMLLVIALAVMVPAAASESVAREAEIVRGHLMPFKCQHDDKMTHTRECALRPECLVTGYGLALADGTFLQFDLEGSRKAMRLLSRSTKTNDLVAEAEGYRVGPLFRVRTIRLK